MTSYGLIISQKSPAATVGTSKLITVPEMIMSLQTLGIRRLTTGWKQTQRFSETKALQCDPRRVTKLLVSVRRTTRWWIRLWLIASHGNPFQSISQISPRCCLAGIGTLKWIVTIPEDGQAAPKRIGYSSTIA